MREIYTIMPLVGKIYKIQGRPNMHGDWWMKLEKLMGQGSWSNVFETSLDFM